MNYITHHRYKREGACGQRLNIPYGTELPQIGPFIAMPDGRGVCFATSEEAKLHFARNDDGRGLERGALTYAIAYSTRVRYGIGPDGRKRQQRFTDEEIEMLERDWKHFLRDDVDVVLFNQTFFDAEPEELRRLARALNIKA